MNKNPKRRKIIGSSPGFDADDPETTESPICEADNGITDSIRLRDEGNDMAATGNMSGALTRFDSALRVLQSCDQTAHHESRLHEARSQIYLALDKDFLAIRAAERACALAPEWSDAWITLGRAQVT